MISSNLKYELSNHLGNVMSVISDRKIARDTSANDTVDYYEPDVLLTFDYSPFGAPLHARSFSKEVCSDTTFTMVVEDLNTNFDDGTTQGWAPLGNAALSVTSGGQLKAEKNGGGQLMGATQSFMATSSVTYDFSIFIEKGSCNPSASILLEVLDPNNTVIYTQTLTSGSQTYSTQFTANITGAYTINVTRIGNASNCYFLIDDILVTHEEEVTDVVCEDYAGYKWGYTGMLKDNEFSGAENSYTTDSRQYNPRLGKWFIVDEMFKLQPDQSTYKAFLNNPIIYTDQEGQTEFEVITFIDKRTGTSKTIAKVTSNDVFKAENRQVGAMGGGLVDQIVWRDKIHQTTVTINEDGSFAIDKSDRLGNEQITTSGPFKSSSIYANALINTRDFFGNVSEMLI